MHRLIDILANAGATGALGDITGAMAQQADPGPRGAVARDPALPIADALAEILGVSRHLASYVSAPDNDPCPPDVPVRPDEDEPDTVPTPQEKPDFPDSQAA